MRMLFIMLALVTLVLLEMQGSVTTPPPAAAAVTIPSMRQQAPVDDPSKPESTGSAGSDTAVPVSGTAAPIFSDSKRSAQTLP